MEGIIVLFMCVQAKSQLIKQQLHAGILFKVQMKTMEELKMIHL